MFKRVLPLLAGFVLLSACAEQKVAHTAKDYQKKTVVQHVIASWYGIPFHGRTAANGERYNMYGFTAAHKTLPFGTTVKFTNESTQQTVIVRVTDRGPFIKGRDFDLSFKAAHMLGIDRAGTGQLRAEILEQKLPATLLALQDKGPLDLSHTDFGQPIQAKPQVLFARADTKSASVKTVHRTQKNYNLIALASPKMSAPKQITKHFDQRNNIASNTPHPTRNTTKRVYARTEKAKPAKSQTLVMDDFIPFAKIAASQRPHFTTTVAQSPGGGSYFWRSSSLATIKQVDIGHTKTLSSNRPLLTKRLFAAEVPEPEIALTHFFTEAHPDFLLDVMPLTFTSYRPGGT